MAISAVEDGKFFELSENRSEAGKSKPKRGRPAKKLHWRKIERYWEEQQLKRDLEDIFFQSTDSESLT